MEAAFFDLDKTVIARSSMMAFAPAFRREGLLSRRTMARGAWTQLLYVRRGAGPEQLARIQRSVLSVTAGWSRADVSRLVAADIAGAIDPITYRGALDAIAEHRAAGRPVLLVSAAPEEVVEPIGARLGVDRVIASRPQVDDEGRYTGQLESYAYGPAKAALLRDLAEREGWDLAGSWAYTDSFTDLPMLEAVGHPVVVNPDRALRRVAQMRGWAVERFDVRGVVAAVASDETAAGGTASGDGAGASDCGSRRMRVVGPVSAVAAAALTGGLTAWWILRRPAR